MHNPLSILVHDVPASRRRRVSASRKGSIMARLRVSGGWKATVGVRLRARGGVRAIARGGVWSGLG